MAPTEETAEVGFLVNSSSFQVDIGRSRFTGKENNDEIAGNFSRFFGTQLVRLFELTKDDSKWSQLKKELRLLPNLERYDFWNSLWALLGEKLSNNKTERGKSYAVDLLHKIP